MYEFVMPSLGADMEEGTFIAWQVQPGVAVKRGDVVCVVETQKGAIDVEIWETGTIARLIAEPGQKLAVGAPLALLATGDEDWQVVAAAAPAAGRAEAAAAQTGPVPAAAAGPAAALAGAPARAAAVERAQVSPAARRRAAELGVDLAQVTPGGPGAPVSVADVERAAAAARPAPATRPGGASTEMRAAIAAAMARSKREIPHYYLGAEIVVEHAATWLEAQNATCSVTERILFAALELRAVALALREVPDLNGSYVDGAFRPADAVHIGVATALRGGGLIAPALHDADRLPLAELMAALRDLLARTRSGQLRSSEMSDATITVTNLGDLGVETVYGVITPPQVALVGLGRVTARPVVVDGAVAVARTVQATLSADHRVTDGMTGARFLASLREKFDHPELL